MSDQTKSLGKLQSVHGVSPAYLQRALVVIILSFIFFMAMLLAFSLREQIGYFLLATAFLIVNLFTLFGFMMQRKKTIALYEHGFTIGKQTCLYSEVKELNIKETGKSKSEIMKQDGSKISLPETIEGVQFIVKRIRDNQRAPKESLPVI